MNKFYTLEGNKFNTITSKQINPDNAPVYYSDHELGSWLTAAVPALSKLSIPMLAKLAPSIPIKIKAPIVKVTTPKISPVKISIPQPKINAKIPPPNQMKIDPKDVRNISQGVKLVGDVTQVIGTGVGIVSGWTGIGAGVGAGIMGVGAGISSVGTSGLKIAETIDTANKIKQGGLIAGLSQISQISGSMGLKDVSNVTRIASNQGQNIQNAIASKDPSKILNTTGTFLNSVGVAPSVGNSLQSASSIYSDSLNIINSNTKILDQIGIKPSSPISTAINRSLQDSKPNTTNKPFVDIYKDPVNDPSHPLYTPPLPSGGNTSNIPKLPVNTVKPEPKKTDSNVGLILIGGLGIFLLMNKKGKKNG